MFQKHKHNPFIFILKVITRGYKNDRLAITKISGTDSVGDGKVSMQATVE